MHFALQFVLVAAPLATWSPAQGSPDDPSTQLAARETAAKDDPTALLQAATWAKEQGLLTDWRRLVQRVLTVVPDHEGANKALGHVKHGGRWMSAAKAEILKNRDAGLVWVAGVWVPEAEAEDARAGVFHAGGELVGRDEYLEIKAGKVRHPRTGELIAAADLEKAKNNMFPDGKGGWSDEAAANQRHVDAASPWVVRTKTTTIVSTLPLRDIEEKAKPYVDDAYDFAITVLGPAIRPAQRPVVMVVPTSDQFRELGNDIGGASSAYGAFLAERTRNVAGLGSVVPAVALLDPNWGVYYLKHAVGVAVAHGIGGSALPAWLVVGIGSYTERFYSGDIANWFGKQFLAAGGLLELEGWFNGFGISGDMDHNAMGQQIYQAGLLVAFCRHGGDDGADKLLTSVGDAIAAGDPRAITAAVTALEKGLKQRGAAVRAYLKTLTQG